MSVVSFSNISSIWKVTTNVFYLNKYSLILLALPGSLVTPKILLKSGLQPCLIKPLVFHLKEYNIWTWNLRVRFGPKHSKTSVFCSWKTVSRIRFLRSLSFSFRNREDWPGDSQVQHPRIHWVPLQSSVQPDRPSQGGLEANQRLGARPHPGRACGVQLRGLPAHPLTHVVRHRPLALRPPGFR